MLAKPLRAASMCPRRRVNTTRQNNKPAASTCSGRADRSDPRYHPNWSDPACRRTTWSGGRGEGASLTEHGTPRVAPHRQRPGASDAVNVPRSMPYPTITEGGRWMLLAAGPSLTTCPQLEACGVPGAAFAPRRDPADSTMPDLRAASVPRAMPGFHLTPALCDARGAYWSLATRLFAMCQVYARDAPPVKASDHPTAQPGAR